MDLGGGLIATTAWPCRGGAAGQMPWFDAIVTKRELRARGRVFTMFAVL